MTRPTPRSTLFPLHDALPICIERSARSLGYMCAPLGRSDRPGSSHPLPASTHTSCSIDTGATSYRRAGLPARDRSEEHTSELQSLRHLVCRLLLEKKKKNAVT